MSAYHFTPPADLATKEQNFATWTGAFSEREISEIKKIGDSFIKLDGQSGSITSEGKLDEKMRRSRVAWLTENDKTRWIYDRMAFVARQLNGQFFEFDIWGFVEDFQYTVYDSEGSHYGWHMDKGNLNTSPRKLSLVLQLSDPSEYEGGDLQFLISGEDPTVAEKKQGLIYAFASWVLHRVTPVTKGTRKSLVVWTAGPKFK